MKNSNFYDVSLDILEYQIRQGLHITNIDNIEDTVKKLKGKINNIHLMELNGVISQIKLDVANANINREKAIQYKQEFESIIEKIKNY